MVFDTADMPKYRCHKVVHALKIDGALIERDTIRLFFNDKTESILIAAGDDENSRFERMTPNDRGYYVVYKDGYISWSPTKAFENGYTLIENEHQS